MWINNPEYRNLPSEYQQVEYIQSSGTQWIDTLYTPTDTTKVQTKLARIANTGYVEIGYYKTADNKDWRLFLSHENKWCVDIPSSGTGVRVSGRTGSDGKVEEIEFGNFYIKNLVSGEIYTGTAGTFTCESTIKLCRNEGQNYTNSDKFYYIKIYDNDVLVRDLVPCYRKADDVIGMYDLVNDQFYTNSGTGTFTKGNDVPVMVEKQVYPKQGWKPGANTIAYYPLKEDVLDYSGNGYNGSGNPNSFTGGVANYSGNSTTLPRTIINRNIFTINFRAQPTNGRHTITQHTNTSYGICISIGPNYYRCCTGPNSNTNSSITYTTTVTGWHMVTMVSDGSTIYLYADNELLGTNTYTGNNGQTLYLGYDHGYNGGAWNGKISELIFEDKIRSEQDRTNYYNNTKANYGL